MSNSDRIRSLRCATLFGCFSVTLVAPAAALTQQLDGLATCQWTGQFSATFYAGDNHREKSSFTFELLETGNKVSGAYEAVGAVNQASTPMHGTVSEYELDNVAYSEIAGTWIDNSDKRGTFWFRKVRGINWDGKAVHDADACTGISGGFNCKNRWDQCEINIMGKAGHIDDSPVADLGKNHPLCDEAFQCFDRSYLDQLGFAQSANIRKGHIEILADFEQALVRYDRNHASEGKKAYVSAPLVGGLRAINWLGNEGGMLGKATAGYGGQGIAEQFVFEHPEDVSRDRGHERLAKPGTEPALYWAIVKAVEKKKKPLTVGEIFYLALEQRRGDAREAMLLAHNTLRSLARPQEEGRLNDADLTGVDYKPGFFGGNSGYPQYVETIRADHASVANLRDNGGPLYHIFGTAFFEMQMQGDIGALPSLLSIIDLMTVSNYSDDPQIPVEDVVPMAVLIKALITENYRPESAASRVANAFEQYLRRRGNKVEDPEKFCFNIWAGRIGASLWAKLGGSIWTSPWGSAGAPQHELRSAGFLGFNLTPPEYHRNVKPLVTIYKSPISIKWHSADGAMLLDQPTESLHGFYAGMFVFPFYEEDSASWGAVTFDFSRVAHEEEYTAAQAGVVHVLRVDLQSQQAAAYEMAVVKGDRYRMQVQPDTIAPALVGADGSRVASTMFDVSAAAVASAATPGADNTPPLSVQVEASEELPAERPLPDDELAAAQREYDQAFAEYTTLVTVGGAGDVDAALARYKAAYARLQSLKQQRR